MLAFQNIEEIGAEVETPKGAGRYTGRFVHLRTVLPLWTNKDAPRYDIASKGLPLRGN